MHTPFDLDLKLVSSPDLRSLVGFVLILRAPDLCRRELEDGGGHPPATGFHPETVIIRQDTTAQAGIGCKHMTSVGGGKNA